MKYLLIVCFSLGLMGCAGDEAKLEEARYLLGKGDAASAQKAYNLVDSLASSSNLNIKYQAIELKAGALVGIAGIDGIKILSRVRHTTDSDNTVALLQGAFEDVSSDGETNLTSALTLLAANTTGAEFEAQPTRVKNNLHFHYGLISFLRALVISIVSSGFTDSSFDATVCQNRLEDSDVTNVQSDLSTSSTEFETSGLNDGNSLKSLVDEMSEDIQAIDSNFTKLALCTYLEQQFSISN